MTQLRLPSFRPRTARPEAPVRAYYSQEHLNLDLKAIGA